MRDVSIIGLGQTPVAEHWDTSLRHLAFHAVRHALDDAGIDQVEALYVGNMLAGELSGQEHLATLVTDFTGMRGAEAIRIEAADASGGAALRQAYIAVASGIVDYALVLGVEKNTDIVGSRRLNALSTSMDSDYEAAQGATPAALAALIMQRYMYEHALEIDAFAHFSVNAHANGALNPNAMYRNKLRAEAFASAPQVAIPVSLFDAAPEGDGAAALILTTTERAKDMVPKPIRILGSSLATDTLSVHDRPDMLQLGAAKLSAQRAYQQAEVQPGVIDLFELHDSFTIMAALSLEACGFADKGAGVSLANEESIGLNGRIPISTFGGLKARGHAGGATGVYQGLEVCRQLRGEAGDNQVVDVKIGMAQSVGGLGGTAVTHIFERAG